MKKILLFLFISVISLTELYAQSDFITCIPSDGSTSGNARAPHGRYRYQRGVILIKPSEMTASGIITGDEINAIAFNYLVAQNIETNGNIDFYLENTADITNTKSTTWATAISTMTLVSSGFTTIPNTAGNVQFPFNGGSTFIYNGGGVYVAFDYQNANNALPINFVTVDCNSTGLTGGFKGGQSDTAVPTTIAASSFRPVILLGKAVACGRPSNFVATNATTTSVDLAFSATEQVNLEYGPYGFTPGTGTVITGVFSPYTLTGLNPSTVYDVYGTTECGPGNLSAISDVFAFNTVFLPTNATYNTGFEQENFDFIGWDFEPINFTSTWFINTSVAGSVLVQDGIASAVSLSNTLGSSNTWMISRGINLTAGSTVTVSYYDRNYLAVGATGAGSYDVTVGNGQFADGQTSVISSVTNLTSTAFVLKTVTYIPPTSGVYYFGFHNLSPINTLTQAVIIDNFTVTETLLANNEFLASKFSVYPNPAKDIVTISSKDLAINSIELSDLNGRIIKNISVNGNESQVNISDLAQGVYMMKIATTDGIATKRIVKE